MRRLPLLATLALIAVPAAARADIISFSAQVHGGASGGQGLGGDRKDEAFHDGATGGTYGARAGVEILFIDVWVQHDQYRDQDGLLGTWTQLMTGFDVELDLGDQKGGTRNDRGEVDGGHSAGYAEFGLGFGFGLGTGQQVEPPLDNGEITDKGVVGQVHVGAGWRLSPSWSIGVQVPVQAAYLIKSGSGATANDLGTHYTEMSAAALLALRINLGK
jgi:hypothetical protein